LRGAGFASGRIRADLESALPPPRCCARAGRGMCSTLLRRQPYLGTYRGRASNCRTADRACWFRFFFFFFFSLSRALARSTFAQTGAHDDRGTASHHDGEGGGPDSAPRHGSRFPEGTPLTPRAETLPAPKWQRMWTRNLAARRGPPAEWSENAPKNAGRLLHVRGSDPKAVLVIRQARTPPSLAARYNVCMHRGKTGLREGRRGPRQSFRVCSTAGATA